MYPLPVTPPSRRPREAGIAVLLIVLLLALVAGFFSYHARDSGLSNLKAIQHIEARGLMTDVQRYVYQTLDCAATITSTANRAACLHHHVIDLRKKYGGSLTLTPGAASARLGDRLLLRARCSSTVPGQIVLEALLVQRDSNTERSDPLTGMPAGWQDVYKGVPPALNPFSVCGFH